MEQVRLGFFLFVLVTALFFIWLLFVFECFVSFGSVCAYFFSTRLVLELHFNF